MKPERETNHKSLLISGNKLRVAGGEEGKRDEMAGVDIGEGMCYGECCELCKTNDTQTSTPEANNTLYVN